MSVPENFVAERDKLSNTLKHMIGQEIENLIKKSIKKLQKEKIFPDFEISEIKVEKPEEKIHGDYATNIAMTIAKQVKKNPLEIAEIIKSEVKSQKSKVFDEVEVAGSGFINFFLSKEYLQKQIEKILKEREKFGHLNMGNHKKIQVEFISANPTGPLTVGNARGGPFGDVLGNILKKAGFKVEKAYYVNDCGEQIIELGKSVLGKEGKYQGDYIKHLKARIKEKEPLVAGKKAAKIIVEEIIKPAIEKLGIKYDEWFWESKLYSSKKIDKVIDFLRKEGLTYEKDGALWFKSKKLGDTRDRVLVKKDGKKTYLAGDIAYHQYKFKEKKFDKAINVWGADHAGDVIGLQAGVSALGYGGKLDIILLQFVTLFEKKEKIKMSKRLGIYVTMEQLLSEIPLDVVRFFFLQKSANTHLNFDLDLAKEQSEKNPVYYVQYAHARICSILKKVKSQKPSFATVKQDERRERSSRRSSKVKSKNQNLKLLNHPSELALMKQLIRFPEVIKDTAKDYQLQRVPQYAMGLAAVFHQFYRDCRVFTEDEALKEARLRLILAAKIVLKNTLDLMGISAPEKM